MNEHLADRLLTAREVADLDGGSKETGLCWTSANTPPASNLPGGALRYRPAAIDAWLDGLEMAAPVPGGLAASGGVG